MKNLIITTLTLTLLLIPGGVTAQTENFPPCQAEVTAQLNDWPTKLAEKYYNNPLAYPPIIEATNQNHVVDPSFALLDDLHTIAPGDKLCIIAQDIALTVLPPQATSAPTTTNVGRLILATTTSTENSGLLAYILPDFEARYGAEVDVIAVGTGQAIALAENGDADVILVHARSRENAFIQNTFGVHRRDVMYNDFVIVGPESDPAGVTGLTDAPLALTQIATSQAPFVSRGDESGTHTKELTLWRAAQIQPEGDWYISAGQGMGAVLTLSDELLAYTLSDRATYLARTLEGFDLLILVEGDERLFNPYGVIAVNPLRHPDLNYGGALAFIDWLTTPDTQALIATFGIEEFGAPLFTPNAKTTAKN